MKINGLSSWVNVWSYRIWGNILCMGYMVKIIINYGGQGYQINSISNALYFIEFLTWYFIILNPLRYQLWNLVEVMTTWKIKIVVLAQMLVPDVRRAAKMKNHIIISGSSIVEKDGELVASMHLLLVCQALRKLIHGVNFNDISTHGLLIHRQASVTHFIVTLRPNKLHVEAVDN